jgi:hypothetical protein
MLKGLNGLKGLMDIDVGAYCNTPHHNALRLEGKKRAEREGFEPSVELSPNTRLAGERLRPLGHLSVGV